MEICRQCRHRVMEEDEDVFVMFAERMTKIRGEWSLTMSRLFPGYLFVKTDRIRDFYKRLGSIGQTAEMSILSDIRKVISRGMNWWRYPAL